ncbi:restriction endonuclease [Caenimonas koreensis DSM 17982]|uniref:Restriction endonuclease n=1 Tax=Caenimonas koreensis DSM 17982 TaxID=1121255 RepID=A0A844BDF6_9BURK|nr:restriction endonuclease [Caenimonas koreensis]MRD49739.1 restriction endonuclease [Caenimonas koreensis DSM 17982]
MTRRSKQGPLEDLMDVIALLPWWAGIALAVATYLGFHAFSASPPIKSVQPGQIGSAMTGVIISTVASVLQFLVPLVCVLGAGLSFIGRKKRKGLVASVTRSKTADALNGMSWQEFELLVGEAFRIQGYQVTETGGGGADGGVDLVLRKGTETWLVQCKQWKAFMVDVSVVRELYGVMAARGAVGGFVVTSGSFSNDSQAFASGRNVKLIDGLHLFGLLQQARTSRTAGAATRMDASNSTSGPVSGVSNVASLVPSCPICSATMIRRTARKGANSGGQFWGCSNFPACRATRG